MSVFDLREFNTLSKRHNYFMTNYRIEGFPTLKENSLILRKILEWRNSNSTDKRFENNIKQKKIVRFTKPENIPYNKIYQSRILIKKKQNNSNGENRPRRLVTNLSKNDSLRSLAFNTNNQIIMSPQKDKDNEVNKNLLKPYYRIRIYSKKAYNSPEVNNPRSPTFNNINSFDNENDPYFLDLNGRKFFTNSFCGLNSDTQSISPEKNLDNNNINKIGTELFRNYDELNKKQFEIYKRKIKKNPISKRAEIYEKQKEKDLKRKNLNMQFQEHMNDVSNDENKMRIIPITKKVLNNINNIKRINNRFRSNKRNYNSNNNINHNHKSLSFIINDNNNNSLNKTVYYKAPNNYNKINNISFSKESNPNNNSHISNNILYSKKALKPNNIYISKYSSPRNIDENNFIENSDTIRQKYVQIESPNNDYNNKTHSLDRHNNPYNFIVPKKRFVEDYTFRKQFTSPVFLSSNDHKVCIKVHLLHGINELFYGKVKTKEKLKMQRVISICFIKEKENENKNGDENNENKKKNENENENKNAMIGANFIKNKNLKNKFDLKILSSIKEEEEKSKLEHDIALLKSEAKQEIKEENDEENNGKKDEKINPDPDLDKNKAKENQKLDDNQKVRTKLLKEKPEIELIKLESKVEEKDNQNSNNTIKRRRFQRSYPNLMSDMVNEQTKVEINETSEEPSKPIINNSSLITAENSSSIQSKLNQRRNKIALLREKKYSNTALFENQKRKWPLKEKKKPKGGLYITDMTLSKFRDTDFETKSTLHTTYNRATYNSTKNGNRRNFFKTKSSLPYLTNYNLKTDEQTYLEYFNNMINNENFVKKMEKEKEKEEKKLKNKKQIFRDGKNEYLRKTNEIKRLKYELELKKNAIDNYKENLKIQINSLNITISNIKAYKDDIENNFIEKYNETLRHLPRKIYDLKLFSDQQNSELKKLKNDVNNLKQMIAKKERALKDVEKWLKLQIYMKEGKKPEDLKRALKQYKGELIFNSMEELENNLSYKQNNNLRLIDKYNKSEREKERLISLLNEQKKSYEDFKKNFTGNVDEKISELNSLKKREEDLIQTINQLIADDTNNDLDEIKKIGNKQNTININTDIICENQMRINELGIKYKPFTKKKSIYQYIDCIFCCILSNDISGISLDMNTSNQLSNINLTRFKKAIIQMNFIEISLNYLISTINNKIASDKNSLQIMEKTCKLIDAYHKMLNVNKNKKEMKKKSDNILKRVEKRANKNYVFSRGKTDYNVVLVQKNKEIEKMKNKKYLKNIDIWDFLHDV